MFSRQFHYNFHESNLKSESFTFACEARFSAKHDGLAGTQ